MNTFECFYVPRHGKCDLKPVVFFYDVEFGHILAFCAAHNPLNNRSESRDEIPDWEIAFRMHKGELRKVSRKEALVFEVMGK